VFLKPLLEARPKLKRCKGALCEGDIKIASARDRVRVGGEGGGGGVGWEWVEKVVVEV
jgi:hypothetical protein